MYNHITIVNRLVILLLLALVNLHYCLLLHRFTASPYRQALYSIECLHYSLLSLALVSEVRLITLIVLL